MNKVGFLTSPLIIYLLVACAPSAQVIQTVMAETQLAMPTQTQMPTPSQTPTPTPIPFSALQLESLIIQANDLPSGFSGSQISNLGSQVRSDYYIQQDLTYKDVNRGIVQIWVYEDPNDVSTVYQHRINVLEENCKPIAADVPSLCFGGISPVSNVGEGAKMSINTIGGLSSFALGGEDPGDYYSLVFFRCHALISIEMQGHGLDNNIVTYASRLDKRLQPSICR